MTGREWTDSGPESVAPGVHRLPLPLPLDGLRAVNVYVLDTDDGVVLVDSGWALLESRLALRRGLRLLGHDLADVRRFLVTHVHRDHYTQAVALRREFGARIALGEGEKASLAAAANRRVPPLTTQFRTLRLAGAGPLVEQLSGHGEGDTTDPSLWEDPDEWTSDDTDITLAGRTLRVITTPGHTNGHQVFRDADAGLLFAGDHVLPHITPSIGFEPVPSPLPLADYLDSLRRVRSLPDTRLLPAHGPVTPSVHTRVDELLEHHAERLAQTAAAVARGAATGYDVARALTWTQRHRAFDDFDPFNQMLAVNETVAHLELLVARGDLHATTGDTLRTYHPPTPPTGPRID